MWHALSPFTDIGYPVSTFEEHVPVRKYLDKYDQAGRFDTYFKFSFVRNPYDRVYSGFRQDLLASTRWAQWIAVKKPIFDVIGDDFTAYMLHHVARTDIVNAWEWICFRPMTAFTHLDGRRVVDWVGRTERLETDLNEHEAKIGVTLAPPETSERPDPRRPG